MNFNWTFVLCIFYLFNISAVGGKTAEACYGTQLDCDYYALSCAQDEVIRLGTLKYGRKEQPAICQDIENHCQNRSVCCTSSPSDCFESFDRRATYEAYASCSGTPACPDVQSPWKLIRCGDSPETSTYVSLQYECDKVSSKLDFCGDATTTGNSIEAMFRGNNSGESFDPSKASQKCGCTITNRMNDVQTVNLTLIDVRLQSYIRNKNFTAKCSSAKLRVTDYLVWTCTESLYHERDNFVTYDTKALTISAGDSYEILLEDLYVTGKTDAPSMIWLSLEAEASNDIEVHCREIIPVTTTTSTTSTSTTPLTTTTITTTTTTIPTTTTTARKATSMATTTMPTTTTTTTIPTTTTTKTTKIPTTTTTTTTTTTIPTTTATIPTTTTTIPKMTTQPTTSTLSTPTQSTTTIPTTKTIPITTTQPTTTTLSTPTQSTIPTTTTILTMTTQPTTTTLSMPTQSTTTIPTTTTILTTTTQPTTTTTTATTQPTSATTVTQPMITTSPTTTQPPPPTTTAFSTTKTTTTHPTTKQMTTINPTTTTTTGGGGQTAAPVFAGGDSKDEQKKKLFLAIFVPFAVLGAIIASFLTWLYLRTRNPSKKHNLLRYDLNKFPPGENGLIAKYTKKRTSYVIKPNGAIVSRNKSLPSIKYVTLPKSSINSHPSLVYDDSPVPRLAQNHFPVSFIPPAVDEDTRPPIHVKMEYLENGSPQSSFVSSGARNGSVIRQPNTAVYDVLDDSLNYAPRDDNQIQELSIELPSELS